VSFLSRCLRLVRVVFEFNRLRRAFNSVGVDTADLGPVPDLLRTLLEKPLSQEASPQALDNLLPGIRDVIINLLQGLKRKQSLLRVRKKQPDVETSTAKSLPSPNIEGSSPQALAPISEQLESENSNNKSETDIGEG